jgi:hypothetical protein
MLSINKCSIAFFCFLFLFLLIVATGCTDEDASVVTGKDSSQPASQTGSGAGALVSKAWALNAQEKFSEAIAALDRAQAIDPATPGIAFNRGWALTGLGKYSDALPVLDQALAENPDSVISWSNKGYALANLGRCQEAVSAYTTASQLEPHNLAIRQSLESMNTECANAVAASSTTLPATTNQIPRSTTLTTMNSPGPSSQAGQLTQSYQDSRFSLKYPAGWTVQENAPGSGSYDLVSLQSDSSGIVWVYGGKTDTTTTLDGFQASQMASWVKDNADFYMVSREKTTLAGNPAIASTYTWTSQEGDPQETYAVVSVIGNRGYIVFYSKSPPSSFETNLPVAKVIINSLQVIPPPVSVSATGQLTQSYQDNRFSLKYPAGWTYKTNTMGVADFDDVSFVSPDDTTLVLFYAGKTGTSQTLDTFQANNLVDMMGRYADFNLVSTKKTTLAGNPAVGTTFTWTSSKDNPQQTYRIVSIIDGREWQVFCTASPVSFEKNLPIANSIINSLQAGR